MILDLHASNSTLLTIVLVLAIIVGIVLVLGYFRRRP